MFDILSIQFLGIHILHGMDAAPFLPEAALLFPTLVHGNQISDCIWDAEKCFVFP